MEGSLALALRLVAMNGRSRDAVTVELLHDLVGPMLGTREDKRAAYRTILQNMREQALLLA